MFLTPINIYLLIVTLVNLLLSSLIYFRSTKTKANLFYALVVFTAAFWTFCMLMFRISEGSLLEIWSVALWAATVPIVYFFLYFSFNFPASRKFNLLTDLLIIIPPLYALYLVIYPHIFLFSTYFDSYKGFSFKIPEFYSYSIYIITYFTFGFIVLFKKYFAEKNKEAKTQIFFVIAGSLFSAVAGVVFGIFFPLAKDFRFYWLSPGLTAALTCFIAYAIMRHKLFRIRVIVTEIFVGIIGLIMLIQIFTALNFDWMVLNSVIFSMFIIFGYYLINATARESQRREEAEKIALKEHELRREAEELAANLKHLDEARTQFLLSTQHHLRSPLSVIQGYLSMIGEGAYGRISAKTKEKIESSLISTRQLIGIVNELLDVARLQMNKGTVVKELVDIVELIGAITEDLRKASDAKKIYLHFEKPQTQIPPLFVDPNGIREAIYNIVDNAIKYTQEGGVTISTLVAGDRLNISIVDTGIGMEEKERDNLFGRIFERGEKAKEVNATGKGIGLYLASQMIIRNGGTIRVESNGKGQGARFIIELPLKNTPSGVE